MNTADRTNALMDYTLRRWFSFEELMTDCDKLSGACGQGNIEEDVNLRMLLETINQRIEFLYERDHI
jgi:5-methylcytosine-specific restriction protein B